MLGNDDEDVQRETALRPQFGEQQQVPRRLGLHVENLREAHTRLASNSQEFLQSRNTASVAPFQGDHRHWNTVLRVCGEAIEELQDGNNVLESRMRSQQERNAVLETQVRELGKSVV